MPSTVSKIAMPGKVASHHELKMYSLPWAIMEPHAGSGGCTPRPRKLSDASIKMTHATRSVATTMTDENVLGKISRHIMCRSRAPTALAASRSEERRVGKECRPTGRRYGQEKKNSVARW